MFDDSHFADAASRRITCLNQTHPSGDGRTMLTDAAGKVGAIVAALCCAGTPLIVAALAAAVGRSKN
jgi:hypothetical protein